MITVPPQEIATFLGNHLDHVLQQSGRDLAQSVVVTHGQFKTGCALMDVLNAVESVQERIRSLLQERRTQRQHNQGGDQDVAASEPVKVRITSLYLLYSLYSRLPIHQNPFLCLFMDIYTTALQDEQQRPERFVVSVILNGDGEELAPSTPSELITIAKEVESKQVNMHFLDDFVPDVPIEDQVNIGQGWESVGPQRRSNCNSVWDSLNLLDKLNESGLLHAKGGGRYDGMGPCGELTHVGPDSEIAGAPSTAGADAKPAEGRHDNDDNDEQEEEELEEWEIEAEKHFQDLEDVAPAPVKTNPKSKKTADVAVNRQQLNAIMEQAAVQPLTFDQEQFMLSQFNADNTKVHIPLPPPEALPGIVDNNPTIAFNLLLYLIQLSSDLDGGDVSGASQKANGGGGHSGKTSTKGSSVSSPEPSIVDAYLDTMTHAKRLTLHSLEVVNRLTGATTLSPRFLHAYIENAIRCCELVEDKVGQARVVRMLCVFVQSLLRSGAITIPGYFHALQSFCIQFARVKEVANLFQSLVEYQRKMDVPSPSPVQTQGPSFRGPQSSQQQSQPPSQPQPPQPPQPPQQLQTSSRQVAQSASMPTTPTTDTPQRSSWLANSGSISNVKSTLSKHTSLNGFSTPGALSQFIHPGPASPAGNSNSNSSSHPNGSAGHSFTNGVGIGAGNCHGNSNGSGLYLKTHHKHSSQHSSASGSLFSSPTVMSASVNAFNTGLGNPTSLTLNGGSNGQQGFGQSNSFRSRSGSAMPSGSTSAPNSASIDNAYDLDAALRASLKDMEARGSGGIGAGSSSSGGSPGSGSGSGSGSSRTLGNGQQQQQQQQQQTIHLGPKGFNGSHLGNQARGRGARRGG